MFDILEKTSKKVLATKISGKLDHQDYNQIFPLVEDTVRKYGKVCLYVELENFEGWDNAQAVWDELKTFKYINDLEKVAVVGDKKWEEYATKASSFVLPAKIKYFLPEQKEEAKNWVVD